jgi:hypothetical protein
MSNVSPPAPSPSPLPAAAAAAAAPGVGALLLHVALFVLSGPSLILLQKYVLGDLTFEYPITIVTCGSFARWGLILGLVHSGAVPLGAHKDLTFMQWTTGRGLHSFTSQLNLSALYGIL